jgi:hypothetical protein
LNSALIGVAGLFKLFSYIEVVLLYGLIRNKDQTSTIFIEEYDEKEYPYEPKAISVNIWRSWSAVASDSQSSSDIFFA